MTVNASVYSGYMRCWGRRSLLLLWLGLAGGCTKSNPAAHCATGMCSDPAYPYCDFDGAIGGDPGTCISVQCSPGSVGACEGSGAALICNAGGNGYDQMPCALGCDATNLTCTMHCTSHAQCASGICKDDGNCATDNEIAFTDPNGAPLSDCSRAAPCTLDRALGLAPPSGGQYVELAAGAYVNSATEMMSGNRHLVGRGASMTSITNASTGPIFTISEGTSVFDSVRISDVKGVGSNLTTAYAVYMPASPAASRAVVAIDCVFSNNANGSDAAGIKGVGDATLVRTIFDGNFDGASVANGTTIVDQCVFSSNADMGLDTGGDYAITNSFFVRNSVGVMIEFAPTMATFTFNTVVDNASWGVYCNRGTSQPELSGWNNLITRNATDLPTSACSFAGSLVGTGVTTLHFASPDTAPYDYHLLTGSVAIDAATNCSVAHDVDGDPRPKGPACDVGADEAF